MRGVALVVDPGLDSVDCGLGFRVAYRLPPSIVIKRPLPDKESLVNNCNKKYINDIYHVVL